MVETWFRWGVAEVLVAWMGSMVAVHAEGTAGASLAPA